jgi:alkaline phosphatase D
MNLPTIATGLSLLLIACKPTSAPQAVELSIAPDQPLVYKVAFGSCAHQDHPLPIFHEVVKKRPDLFIFLGDNIYADTRDMTELRQKYHQLGSKPSYQELKKHVEIVATWDDHDYGQNDAGKNYPLKRESKNVFLDFFEEPKDSERFTHDGIYTSMMRQVGDKTVQIILTDGRTFRDDLLRIPRNDPRQKSFYRKDYSPHTDDTPTLLGEQQWQWLEKQLSQPADFRVLASGTQFGIEANGYEAWANFPHEQQRLVKLISKTKANNLVVISGDVHYAEISKFKSEECYPIYDITSSGLSRTWKFATPNKNRIEGPIMDNHFGLLTIVFSAKDPSVKAEIWDIRGNQRVEHSIPFRELQLK